MQALGVHHVAINVSDVDEAVAFYTERLGLTVRTDRPDFGFPGAWLDAGQQQVHLVQGAASEQKGQHLALLVADLDAALGELRDVGVEVSDVFPVGSSRQAFVADPSGNRIELHQPG
jgi:glyoxylase I family protein